MMETTAPGVDDGLDITAGIISQCGHADVGISNGLGPLQIIECARLGLANAAALRQDHHWHRADWATAEAIGICSRFAIGFRRGPSLSARRIRIGGRLSLWVSLPDDLPSGIVTCVPMLGVGIGGPGQAIGRVVLVLGCPV